MKASLYDIPLAANQVYYNLLHRQPEVNDGLDACRELNVALIAFFPLASGRLALDTNRPAASSRPSSPTQGKQREVLQETLCSVAQERGKSVSQVTLNWLLYRDKFRGPTSVRHALDNADALTWEMSDDEFVAIDQAAFPRKC